MVRMVLLILLALAGEAGAATYYVSPGGYGDVPSNGYTKTQAQNIATPWRTISYAVAQLLPGDTLLARGGTFSTGETTATMTVSGTAVAPIVVKNYPGERPVIDWLNTGQTDDEFLLQQSPYPSLISYITIEGFEIKNGYEGIKISGPHDHITLRNNYIHHTHENGIVARFDPAPGSNLVVDRNILEDIGWYIPACPDPLCNQIHGMYLGGSNITVTNNLIYNVPGYGAFGHGCVNCLFANNTIAYTKNRAGLLFWTDTTNTIMENNLLYENCSQACGSAGGIDLTSYAGSGNIVRNNIFYATSPRNTVFMNTGLNAGTGVTATGNCSVNNGPCGTAPTMVNAPATLPAAPNLRPLSGSVMLGYGLNLYNVLQPLGITLDLDGSTWPSAGAWTVGAYLNASTASSGTTYYVGTSGSDSYTATQAQNSSTPWRTIQHCNDAATAGGTCVVLNGTYTACQTVGGVTQMVIVNKSLTFRALNKRQAILDGLNLCQFGFNIAASNVTVRDFDIKNMAAPNVSGIGINVNTAGVTGTVITGNHIHTIGKNCQTSAYGVVGIFLGANVNTTTITQNEIDDIGRLRQGESGCDYTGTGSLAYQNGDHGIYFGLNTGVSIVNNLFYNNDNGWSIQLYSHAISDLTIRHNTFADPNPNRPGHILISVDLSNSDISNNIFYNPTTSAIVRATNAGVMTNVTVRNNTSTNVVMDSTWTGISGITFSGSLNSSNPSFVSAATRNYQLNSNSPAIDTGLNLGVTTDYAGAGRPNGAGYDIGAYEYGGGVAVDTTPPAAPTGLFVQ